jgi:hypothetical protein
MQENEEIFHPLITKSIRNAQDKLAKKVSIELYACSQKRLDRKKYPLILNPKNQCCINYPCNKFHVK